MKTPTTMHVGTAVLCVALAGGWAGACVESTRPTGATAPKPVALAPAAPPKAPGRTAPAPNAPPPAAHVATGAPGATSDAAAAPGAPAARPPAPDPLIGHVTRAELENYETWKTLRAQDYTPDAAAVKTIAERGKDVQIVAVVATWCPDSKREVPRFFKIYDQAGLGMGKVTMVAVDRSKKDAEGLTVKYEILRVPTFVFLRGDKEIGRVTERAVTTLEQDIAAILTK